jgi:NAD(P)-dependent dehydrogenase (short-subunit alcohol dehydrogenase family)
MPNQFPGLAKWTFPVMTPEQHADALTVVKRAGPNALKGKTALVTGGSSGIGVETVRAFASAGARVFVLVRQVEKTKSIMDRIAAEFPDNGGLEIVHCELDSLDSVNNAANEVLKRTKQLNILINNAGSMNAPFELTKDGFESQLAICHIAHFLLFKKLLPLLLSSSTPEFNSRVVCVSSSAHNYGQVDLDDPNFTNGREYNGWAAYGQAKICNVWMANHIDKLYGSQGLHALSLHPGGIQTELQRTTPMSEFQKIGFFNDVGEYQLGVAFKTPEQGAATSVWAATAPELEGKGALFLEDVAIAQQSDGTGSGYAAWAFDEVGAAKLWDWTEQAVSKFIKD